MLNLNTQIQTDRLDLQVYEPSFTNAQVLFELLQNNQEHFYYLYGIVEKDKVEDIYAFLEKRYEDKNSYFYAIRLKERKDVIGFISVLSYDIRNKHAVVGYFLDKSEAGKGYITEVLDTLIRELFTAGCHKISTTVDAENIASRKVCEKCHFKLEAILEDEKINHHKQEYEDVFLYSIINKN